jgi:predicted nucleic acid-binding protein
VIFADSSVWIDFFNGKATVQVKRLIIELNNWNVGIGDLIALEVLQGFKKDADYKTAKKLFESLATFELLGNEALYSCADNYRYLRKKGVTVRKTADVIIATFCIDNAIPLLFSDRDFKPFIAHLGLMPAQDEDGRGVITPINPVNFPVLNC